MSELPPTNSTLVPFASLADAAEPPLATLAELPPLAAPASPPSPPPSLPYTPAVESRQRPGLVTTIGVISIVVACLSILCSLGLGVEAAAFYVISKMSAAFSTVTAASTSTSTVVVSGAPAPAVPAGSGVADAPSPAPVGPGELPAAQRETVVGALAVLQPLKEERRNQLMVLFTQHGRDLFPDDGQPLTAAGVRAMVKQSQTEAPLEGGGDGSTSYVLRTGILRVFNDRAEFATPDGSVSLTSRAENSGDADVGNSIIATGAPTTLTAQQVSGVLARIRSVAVGGLNTAQAQTLQQQLSLPNQQLVDPTLVWTPVQSANKMPDGSVLVQFTGKGFAGMGGGMLQVDPQGQIGAQTTFSGGGGPGAPFPFATAKFSPARFSLIIIEDLLSIGLAIYLLVAGIMVLRQSASGRKLHLIFAVFKVPLAIAAGVGLTWLFTTFLGAAGPGVPASAAAAARTPFVMMGIGLSVIGCIYPIALLIALNTRSLRNYYGSIR